MIIEIRSPGRDLEVVNGYAGYLKSNHWERIKAEFMAGFPACDSCGYTDRLTIHHKTYARLGNENMTDLACLCWDCHQKEHIGARLSAAKSILNCESEFIRVIGPSEKKSKAQSFAFTIEDVARIAQVPVRTLRRRIKSGVVDPENLESVCVYFMLRWMERRLKEERMKSCQP